jgi:hypothetical protein
VNSSSISSGRSNVVTLRSACVMIRIFVLLLKPVGGKGSPAVLNAEFILAPVVWAARQFAGGTFSRPWASIALMAARSATEFISDGVIGSSPWRSSRAPSK